MDNLTKLIAEDLLRGRVLKIPRQLDKGIDVGIEPEEIAKLTICLEREGLLKFTIETQTHEQENEYWFEAQLDATIAGEGHVGITYDYSPLRTGRCYTTEETIGLLIELEKRARYILKAINTIC